MSEELKIALITSIPPTIAALAVLLVSVKNSAKSDTIIEKTAEIHTLTNSNLSKTNTKLDVANQKIDGLEKLVTEMKMEKKK